MANVTRFVGLDVHAKLIAVAVADGGRDGEVRSHGTMPNDPEAIRRLIKRLQSDGHKLRVCYEAGPTGFGLYWQLTAMGIDCTVVAPTLIPQKPGERVKTDRLDAIKLARCHRAGELTSVWVPDKEHEELRDLVRSRDGVRKHLLAARHQLAKFLLKHAVRSPEGVRSWTSRHLAWLRTVHFDSAGLDHIFQDHFNEVDHQSSRLRLAEAAIDEAIKAGPPEMSEMVAALQMLRGVAKTTAAALVAEIGCFSRFDGADKLMSYVGVVPSEYSTGGPAKRSQGGITKQGNGHVRRLVTESAWNYRFQPITNARMKACEKGVDPKLLPELKRISSDAQQRLCGRYRHLLLCGKNKHVTVTAVGRELLGFVWAIGVTVEQNYKNSSKAN